MSYQLITKDRLAAEIKKNKYQVNELAEIPKATFKEGIDLRQHIKLGKDGKRAVAEFIGADAFASQFYERQRYEVDAGRDEEPELFHWLYSPIVDSGLPEIINTYTLGPAGVVLEQITEGGEVKFVTVGQGSKSVQLYHYAAGLRYTEDLIRFNKTWQMPLIERQFGIAHGALRNDLHLSPILGYAYAAANQTDGTALTSFAATASLPEKYLRAIEAAITAAVADTTNPRRGPYGLLCATADLFTIERALNRVAQQGFDLQTSAIGRIRAVVAYDGWTGTRGKKATSYSGVSAGTAYLVDLANRMIDFQSFVQQPWRRQSQPGDLKRFIVEEVVWDTWLGVYSNPIAAVEEITWPVAASGTS